MYMVKQENVKLPMPPTTITANIAENSISGFDDELNVVVEVTLDHAGDLRQYVDQLNDICVVPHVLSRDGGFIVCGIPGYYHSTCYACYHRKYEQAFRVAFGDRFTVKP